MNRALTIPVISTTLRARIAENPVISTVSGFAAILVFCFGVNFDVIDVFNRVYKLMYWANFSAVSSFFFSETWA